MTTHTRKWQTRRVGPAHADTVVADAQPLMELRIYEHTILLTRRVGSTWRQYPIAPAALAQMFARVPTSSGLLPAHTLAAGQIAGSPFLVVYVPASVRRIQTTQRSVTIPVPPLVFGGHRHDWRIFALAGDIRTDSPLAIAPFPNCYPHGAICWGDVQHPDTASPASVAPTLKLFLEESAFNQHLANGKSNAYPNSVIAHWSALDEAQVATYPLDDLMPANLNLGWLIAGGPWSR